MTNVIFFVGTGRCGSTLVQEIICRHPDLAFVSNLDDRLAGLDLKGRWNNDLYRRVPPDLTRKGRLRFAPSEGYRLLERQVSPVLVEPSHDLTAADATPWLVERLRSFVNDRVKAQQKPTFLHKFTGWPRAGFLREAFPDARFVHIVRDGRAVANSLVQMAWWSGFAGPQAWRWGPIPSEMRALWESSDRSFPLLAAIEWQLLIEAHEVAEQLVPEGNWMNVRYEDIVEQPIDSLATILEFCGLGAGFDLADQVARQGISGGRMAAFRDQLSKEDLEAIDRAIEPTLARYGYA